ncbi:hypothetical protein DY000_02060242 [Brassica cretica]|uniref:Uncharacterized protein n=1 Tax=Brassica cretica TaxID=69181 RepID=A0ABQ7B105_BRACR|nr:hypothetical protein DY000_02060242 [Brassica cretica]
MFRWLIKIDGDVIMDQLVDEHSEIKDKLADEDVLAIPDGAMSDKESDEALIRRNRLLQEAITKHVIEATENMMDDKFDAFRQENQA